MWNEKSEQPRLKIVRPQQTSKPFIPTYQQQQVKQQKLKIIRPQQVLDPSAAGTSKSAEFQHAVAYDRAKKASSKAKHTTPISKGKGKELVAKDIPWRPGPDERAFGYYKCDCGVSWASASSWVDKTQACKTCGRYVLPHKQSPLTHDFVYLLSISDAMSLPNLSQRAEDKLPVVIKKGSEVYIYGKKEHDTFGYTKFDDTDPRYSFCITNALPFPAIHAAEVKLHRQEIINPEITKTIYEIAFGYLHDPHKPHMQDLCQKCKELGRLCTLEMKLSSHKDYPNDVVVKGLPIDITEPQLIETFRAYGSILRVYLPEPKHESSSSSVSRNRIAFITFQNPQVALQKFNSVGIPVKAQQYKP